MAVATRQQRGRAVFAETLVGGAIRRLFRAHAGNEQGLPVIVFAGGDAQGLAQAAAGAIGSDQQARGEFAFALLVGDAQAACDPSCDPPRPMKRAGRYRVSRCSSDSRTSSASPKSRADHHLPESLAAVVGGLQPGPAEVALSADMDAPDRAGGRAQLRHHSQRGQRVDRGAGEAEVALVEDRRA